jgi:hypothetical protein
VQDPVPTPSAARQRPIRNETQTAEKSTVAVGVTLP